MANMKIEKIFNYRDGGTVSILLSNVNKELITKLELPLKPKIIKNNEDLYEVFRCFSIGSKDKNLYFFGDINGEYKQLFLDNPILIQVKELLQQEKIKRDFYLMEKFLINL